MDDTSESSLADHIQESPLLKRAFLRLEFIAQAALPMTKSKWIWS
ncbi:hypothetical protein HAP32_02585 [Serratia fonticola]|nr:hypothetical protein HAP32_02585 [Serratia fonticola]